MGREGGMTDDDSVCPGMAAILIQPPRLRDSLSSPAPLPGAPCFTVFMETLSALTIFFFFFAALFYLSLTPRVTNCSSLSSLISLLLQLSLSSVHNFLLAYCHNLFLFFCCLKPFFVVFCHLSASSLVPTETFFFVTIPEMVCKSEPWRYRVAAYGERLMVVVQHFGLWPNTCKTNDIPLVVIGKR